VEKDKRNIANATKVSDSLSINDIENKNGSDEVAEPINAVKSSQEHESDVAIKPNEPTNPFLAPVFRNL